MVIWLHCLLHALWACKFNENREFLCLLISYGCLEQNLANRTDIQIFKYFLNTCINETGLTLDLLTWETTNSPYLNTSWPFTPAWNALLWSCFCVFLPLQGAGSLFFGQQENGWLAHVIQKMNVDDLQKSATKGRKSHWNLKISMLMMQL